MDCSLFSFECAFKLSTCHGLKSQHQEDHVGLELHSPSIIKVSFFFPLLLVSWALCMCCHFSVENMSIVEKVLCSTESYMFGATIFQREKAKKWTNDFVISLKTVSTRGWACFSMKSREGLSWNWFSAEWHIHVLTAPVDKNI